ncbi:MAG TPA: aminotransferase class I/II-fold pyridoxal phosphate-dependent enzyme [Xanthomonadaceae bacterium]|nr:aminotransferase class I/II-fold pyridoxal phosphate-dependent enzyme [Xanthomonadaceae bacterium]
MSLYIPLALRRQPVQNPFPGLAWLEAKLGHPIVDRLGANEALRLDNDYGVGVLDALAPQLSDLLQQYPDPSASALRRRLGHCLDVDPAALLIDAGADSLLLLFLRAATDAGLTVVSSAGTYPTFNYFAAGLGLATVEVPYRRERFARCADLPALLRAAHDHSAAVVYLADPDNPTGTSYDEGELLAFATELPASCLLLLDEAYADFAATPRSASMVPQMVRLRSFSKGYGLAGLRLGYAIADPALLAIAQQVRIHYAVSGLAQAVAAELLDTPQQAALRKATLALRDDLSQRLAARDIPQLPSATNFVTIPCRSAATAAACQSELWQAQIAVHRPTHPAMADLLRVTVHPRASDSEVLDALAAAV